MPRGLVLSRRQRNSEKTYITTGTHKVADVSGTSEEGYEDPKREAWYRTEEKY